MYALFFYYKKLFRFLSLVIQSYIKKICGLNIQILLLIEKNCFLSSHQEKSNCLLKPNYQLKNLRISVIKMVLPHFLSSLSAGVCK